MFTLETTIPGLFILEPRVFEDERGYFFESCHEDRFREYVGQDVRFVQDNHSRSFKNVLRGLHYQIAPEAQGKLVRVVQGTVFDVAVDIRANSPTHGKWVGVQLSHENKRQLWVPPGFAHGFLALTDTVDLLYKTTNYYSPQHERCIAWDDPDIGIKWPIDSPPRLSPKDQIGASLSSLR